MVSGQATDAQKLEITSLQLEASRKRIAQLEKEVSHLRRNTNKQDRTPETIGESCPHPDQMY